MADVAVGYVYVRFEEKDIELKALHQAMFVLEQLSELDGISYRAMMGEFIPKERPGGKLPPGLSAAI